MAQTKIGIRELKTRLGRYVRKVKTGEAVVITERGKPVGLIVPMGLPAASRMKELVQTGLVAWSGRKLRKLSPVAKTRGKRTVADLLLEDRE